MAWMRDFPAATGIQRNTCLYFPTAFGASVISVVVRTGTHCSHCLFIDIRVPFAKSPACVWLVIIRSSAAAAPTDGWENSVNFIIIHAFAHRFHFHVPTNPRLGWSVAPTIFRASSVRTGIYSGSGYGRL